MSKNIEIQTVLDKLVEQWFERASLDGYPSIEPDENWPSPCEFNQDERSLWKPVLQSSCTELENHFNNVGEALGIKINEQYAQLFSRYYSDNLNVSHRRGNFQLLQAWSQSDFERLQQNLIGHLLMKKKLKQEPTLFFGLTDEEDLNLVVDNATGEVCLEYVGKEPHEVIATDLTTFLHSCRIA